MDLPYWQKLQNVVLEHRYRYYVLDHPIISDMEYDFVEREYEKACAIEGVKSILIDSGVGFDLKNPEYAKAKFRVDSNQDNYSLWEKEMMPIWDKLGRPKVFIK